MSSAHQAAHSQRKGLSIPQFEPLPPTSLLNRIINKVLAPLYYLLFSIITAIIIVPIYTVIENFKRGRNSKGGQRVYRSDDPSKPQSRSQAKDFLNSYSSSYVAKDGVIREKNPKASHHHHHHEKTQHDETTT
ncbi:hypothetical protein ES702_00249 [subsurface metagenome]